MARVYGIQREALAELPGFQLRALVDDMKAHGEREQLETETLMRLKAWLEAQGG